MGVGGGSGVGTKVGRVQTGTSKGLLDAYQQMRSHQAEEDGTDERSANAPTPPSSIHSAPPAADPRSQAAIGGCIVSKQTKKKSGGQ